MCRKCTCSPIFFFLVSFFPPEEFSRADRSGVVTNDPYLSFFFCQSYVVEICKHPLHVQTVSPPLPLRSPAPGDPPVELTVLVPLFSSSLPDRQPDLTGDDVLGIEASVAESMPRCNGRLLKKGTC